jgi:hypothetical protein
MINLNIIPENLKKDIKLKQFYDLLKNFLSINFILLLVFLTIFLLFKLALSNYYIRTISETNFLSHNTEIYSRQVQDINGQIDSVKSIQKEFIYWSKVLEFIRTSKGQGINLANISIDRDKKALIISGQAVTRDTLLGFKNMLDKSNYFEKFDLPIENLLKKDDIKFDMNLIFKTYEF